ncbi:M28 family metallopeptidase [Priestia filamentosa]|uniref:M28 family metallopeptidase n=1 Tax=Priestia filamentosa TaxID=1402861 RepID=UPI002E20E052|nr:M28 family metallopeptidase [Priestia filamentosa]
MVLDAQQMSRSLPWIQTLVDKISRSQYESYLKHLVSYPNRFSTSSYYKDAAIWAHGQLKGMGYSANIENISVNDGISHNIIADKQGQHSNTRNLIIVTAHLDSVNHEGGAMANAPGADDNGSGSAGLIEIASVLKELPIQHDLRFILFGGEEQGLLGSKQYIGNLSNIDKSRIRAVINMDMIGSLNTRIPTVLLEGAAISQSIINELAEAAATYTSLEVQTSLNPFASDHVPFIQENIPAVLTIEGKDEGNQNEHTSNDTIDLINYELALDILKMNVAFIASQLKSD